jgi:hypothetical protein
VCWGWSAEIGWPSAMHAPNNSHQLLAQYVNMLHNVQRASPRTTRLTPISPMPRCSGGAVQLRQAAGGQGGRSGRHSTKFAALVDADGQLGS